jgi:hypothetical protein
MTADNAAHLTVSSTVDPFTERGQDQFGALGAVPAPAETLFSIWRSRTSTTSTASSTTFPRYSLSSS